jgi:acetyltransferase EpsM
MEASYAVTIPLLNANEPEALLSAIYVQPGQQVACGDLLFSIETTKANAEVVAENAGFVTAIRFSQGQMARAGEVFCYLAAQPDWTPPVESPSATSDMPLPAGLRITDPALALVRQHQIEFSQLPTDRLITENLVRSLLSATAAPEEPGVVSDYDATAILIYGAGGHGKSLVDLLRALHSYRLVGFIDDGHPPGRQEDNLVMGLPVLGGGDQLAVLYHQGIHLAVNAVGGIGNVSIRIKVFQKLAQAGFVCPAVVHPSAWIEPSAALSAGAQVFPHAYVGSEAQIGYGCIINTGAIVSHDCRVDEFANISPGAMLAGEVQVGAGALIGMGVTINLQVKIGAGARIGNGATVKTDVPDHGIVRAGSIWPVKD